MTPPPRGVAPTLLLLALLPSLLAAFGLWTSAGAAQQAWVLDSLLALTLWLESGHFESGVLGTWEIPAALVVLAAWTVAVAAGERRLPALRWLWGPVEIGLALLGILGAAGLVAVAVGVDRAFFVAALGAGLLSIRGERRGETPWSSKANLPWRLAVVVGAAGMVVYGAASLLEGATWTNPAFRPARWWVDGPGQSPWSSGGIWLLLGVGALPRWRSLTAPALGVIVLGAIGSAATAGASHVAIARALSALGVGALIAGVAPLLAPPICVGWSSWDPRRWARSGAPLLLVAGLCVARGLSVSLWTAPPTLPPGVEQLADLDCTFGLRTSGDAIWFTDRCRNTLHRLDGEHRSWPLAEHGGTQVEELGGPANGALFVATAAWTDEAQLVLLAIEEEGPRRVDEGFSEGPDAPYVPLPSCWASAWVPVADGRVVLGCENTGDAHVFEPASRSVVQKVPLGTRLEAGSFDPNRGTLYGVALWDNADVHAWRWPSGEVSASRRVGPFNWSALHVPDDDAVWVSRFLEGVVLRLDPDDLGRRSTVPLSFGIRALHHDPVHRLVWASASYTGRLWAVSTDDPDQRNSLSLCGQARDLATDDQGRLIVGTDCGVFRIDPAVAFAG